MVTLGLFLTFSSGYAADSKKVLVVMSYEPDYPWDIEVKEGIDSVLKIPDYEVTYFYMNTKQNLAGSKEMGKEAYALYQELQPDGVIAMDDNAQTDFVLPFLKGKNVPVIFGGVNEEPEAHGYPASNVTGILDRFHLSESISFAQELVPGIRTVGFIMKDSPTARFLKMQIDNEANEYPAEKVTVKMPSTVKEALFMTEEYKKEGCDLLFVAVLSGIIDEEGSPLSEKQAVQTVAKAFGGPTITNLAQNVKNGTLCAVVKTGQEQGSVAAEMLVKVFDGTSISQIPIVRNRHGKRMINATVLKELGIKPQPMALRGVQLVKSE